MTIDKRTEHNILLVCTFLGLVCVLAYTFVHTSALFARYIYPWWVGYISAFGVELIIAAMSYKLANNRNSGKGSNGFLMFALIVSLTVSAFANIDEGHLVRHGEHLTLENIGQLDPIQAFIGLSATGLISFLVFAVSKIAGFDANIVVRKVERVERKMVQVEQQTERVTNGRTDYKTEIFKMLDSGEQGVRGIAKTVGCSVSTASKWVNEWKSNMANPADIPATTGGRNGQPTGRIER